MTYVLPGQELTFQLVGGKWLLKKKVFMLILWGVLTIASAIGIWLCGKYDYGLLEAIAGALIAIFMERGAIAIQDLMDTTDWKASQRKLQKPADQNRQKTVDENFVKIHGFSRTKRQFKV